MKSAFRVAPVVLILICVAFGEDSPWNGVAKHHNARKGYSQSIDARLGEMQRAIDAQEQKIRNLEMQLRIRDSTIGEMRESMKQVEILIS